MIKSRIKINIMKRLKNNIKWWDDFGYPISLNYKGRSTFNTILGGSVSLLIRTLLLSYFIYQCISIFTYGNSSVTKSSYFRNLSVDNT